MEKTEKYRVETGSVYKYSEQHKAYLFVGRLNGKKLSAWIADYEDR